MITINPDELVQRDCHIVSSIVEALWVGHNSYLRKEETQGV